jgi:hydrogenase expression/formation protein HypD
VTPTAYIDKCVEYALTPGFALVSFGDMLKVSGSRTFSSFADAKVSGADGAGANGADANSVGADSSGANGLDASGADAAGASEMVSLERAKGFGARVELVYSPFDVLAMAEREPDTMFVIAAVGFETTAPAYALLMDELISRQMTNVMFLTALKSAIPAIEWVCESGYDIDGFLCPGHVSVITGSSVYEPLAEKYGKPFVAAGFEAVHIVDAIYELVKLASKCVEHDTAGHDAQELSPSGDEPIATGLVANCYTEAVSAEGNVKARDITDQYFDHGAAVWRGLGAIAGSGFYLKSLYIDFDAGSRSLTKDAALPEGCRCADVITGRIDPDGCPMFGEACTPENARGTCMVSAEGACGIWYANT